MSSESDISIEDLKALSGEEARGSPRKATASASKAATTGS